MLVERFQFLSLGWRDICDLLVYFVSHSFLFGDQIFRFVNDCRRVPISGISRREIKYRENILEHF